MGSINLAIPAIATNQASPEITANAAVNALDKALNSKAVFATADADVMLTAAQFIAAMFLSFTDATTANRHVVIPQVNADSGPLSKLFIVENNTTGGFNLVITTASSPAGTDATVAASDGAVLLYSDGTNVIVVDQRAAASMLASLTDVDISSAANGDVLTYNSTSSKWENHTASGSAPTAIAGVNNQTASYTVVLGDAGFLVRMNVASANNLTIPPNSSVAFPTNTVLTVRQVGAGATTIVAGAGVTINSPSTLGIARRQGTVQLVKVATDTWDLIGDVS